MAEPSRSNPVKHLSNFVGTALSFVRHREGLSWLKNILDEMPPGTLRHTLQVCYGRSYGGPIPLCLPFVQILEAVPHRVSVESEPNLSTNLQDRVELQYWARLANRRDQNVGPCRARYDQAIRVYRLAANLRGLAEGLGKRTKTYLTLTSVLLGSRIDLKPLYRSNTALSPVLPCAHS